MKKKSKSAPSELKTGDSVPNLKNIKWTGEKPDIFKKKYTAVIFWNTWDDNSVNSLSEWNGLQEKYSDILTVVGLSDQTKEDMEDCLKTQSVSFANGSVPAGLFRQYMEGYYMIPAVFLVSSEKKLIWRGLPFYIAKIMKILTEENGSEKEVDEFEIVRQRFDNLRYAMSGNNSECLSDKEKYKSYARDYLKLFPEDSFVQDILDEFEVLIPGEKVPSLKKKEWLSVEAEMEKKAFLAVFIEGEEDLLSLGKLHKKFQSSLPVVGLIKMSRTADFKLSRIKAPAAQISDDLYNRYMTKNTVKNGINSFLVSSSGKLLFSSSVSEIEIAAAFFVSEKNADKKLLNHFLDKEKFDSQSRELSGETELSEDQFSEIYELGKKILSLEPQFFHVLSRLADLSCRISREKPKKVCAEYDTSSWTADLIRKLIADFSEMDDIFYPSAAVLHWAEKAVRMEPENPENYFSFSDVLLRAGRKKDAEVMRKKGERLR